MGFSLRYKGDKDIYGGRHAYRIGRIGLCRCTTRRSSGERDVTVSDRCYLKRRVHVEISDQGESVGYEINLDNQK